MSRECAEKPALAASDRGATPDAAIVAALAHGALAAADGESVDETAIAAAPAGMGPALAAHLPAGADPDAVRDWFELETIVDLPAPALSFAEAEAAAADYRRAARADNTRRAYRAGVAAFTEWCSMHRADRIAGLARDRRGVSRGRGGQGPRGQHLAAAPRCVALSAPVGRLPAADRFTARFGDLCRHPSGPSPAVAKEDGPRARAIARGDQDDPRHPARAPRPRPCSWSALPRRCGPRNWRGSISRR